MRVRRFVFSSRFPDMPSAAPISQESGQTGTAESGKKHGVRRYPCDAGEPASVERLFRDVVRDLGSPTLVVHNIDGRVPEIFRKGIAEAEPSMALDTLGNSVFRHFWWVNRQRGSCLPTNPIATG